MGRSQPSVELCGLRAKRGTPCLRNATSRALKTATLCHYETPNTLGEVGFLKAYSATTEEPWKCGQHTTQATKRPDSSGQRQEQGAHESGAERLKEINMW